MCNVNTNQWTPPDVSLQHECMYIYIDSFYKGFKSIYVKIEKQSLRLKEKNEITFIFYENTTYGIILHALIDLVNKLIN